MPAANREAPKRAYDMTTRAAATAATRERILRAIYELLREHAYEDVTLKMIATAAGVSVQTILLHFGSKEGLLVASIDWWRPKEVALREAPEGDIDEAARIVCGRYEENGKATLRFLAAEDRVPALAELTRVGRATHRAWVERTFGSSIRATGKARERRLMQLVVAFDVYAWEVLRRVFDEDETRRTMAEMARSILEATKEKGSR